MRSLWLWLVVLVVQCAALPQLRAQATPPERDSTQVSPSPSAPADTTLPRWPVPNRAVLYSVLLPGAGQLYNRDWWKAPIVWAGVGTAIYFIQYNHREFSRYRGLTETADEPLRLQYRALRDYHRRNRDFTILLTAVGYALVAVEAYVDAHLYYFDVSDNLSMAIRPGVQATGPAQVVPTLGLALRWGR